MRREDEKTEPTFIIDQPERSEWLCHLFGCVDDFTWRPNKGKEPNWFWRWMQFLFFGNRWEKRPEKKQWD